MPEPEDIVDGVDSAETKYQKMYDWYTVEVQGDSKSLYEGQYKPDYYEKVSTRVHDDMMYWLEVDTEPTAEEKVVRQTKHAPNFHRRMQNEKFGESILNAIAFSPGIRLVEFTDADGLKYRIRRIY